MKKRKAPKAKKRKSRKPKKPKRPSGAQRRPRKPARKLKKERRAAHAIMQKAFRELGIRAKGTISQREERARAALVPTILKEFPGVETKAEARRIARRVPIGLVARKKARARATDPVKGYRHVKGNLWRSPKGKFVGRSTYRRAAAQFARWERARMIAKAAGVSVREADHAQALVADEEAWRAERET